MAQAKTPEDLIMVILINSGLSKEDEATQQLAGELSNLYDAGMNAVELECRISEIELSLTQKNKIISALDGKSIVEDMQQRDLIDPRILSIRLKNLRKMQRSR